MSSSAEGRPGHTLVIPRRVVATFEALLASPQTKPLTPALVAAYELRASGPGGVAPVPQAPTPEPRAGATAAPRTLEP